MTYDPRISHFRDLHVLKAAEKKLIRFSLDIWLLFTPGNSRVCHHCPLISDKIYGRLLGSSADDLASYFSTISMTSFRPRRGISSLILSNLAKSISTVMMPGICPEASHCSIPPASPRILPQGSTTIECP